MNIHQFMDNIRRIDKQFEKEHKRSEMNRFEIKKDKKVKKVRVSGKRDWINAKEEI